MENLGAIYYINLERRQDRNQHFLNECEKQQIPMEKIVRFAAIDGTTYEFTPEQKDMFRNAEFVDKPFGKKIMGNQLSHFQILCDILQKGHKYSIVFQDDAILRDGFVKYIDDILNNMPSDAELVNIGFHDYAAEEKFVPWDFTSNDDDKQYLCSTHKNKYICRLKPTINPCSLAYIVTEKGAKNMVEYFIKTGFLKATDVNYNYYLYKNRIFYGSTTVLATSDMTFPSDIFL